MIGIILLSMSVALAHGACDTGALTSCATPLATCLISAAGNSGSMCACYDVYETCGSNADCAALIDLSAAKNLGCGGTDGGIGACDTGAFATCGTALASCLLTALTDTTKLCACYTTYKTCGDAATCGSLVDLAGASGFGCDLGGGNNGNDGATTAAGNDNGNGNDQGTTASNDNGFPNKPSDGGTGGCDTSGFAQCGISQATCALAALTDQGKMCTCYQSYSDCAEAVKCSDQFGTFKQAADALGCSIKTSDSDTSSATSTTLSALLATSITFLAALF